MKSEKGITLVSLIIYIIVLCIVIGILGIISEMFFANTHYLTDNSKNISEFNKFSMYFIEDVKNNKTIRSMTNNQIVFEDGTSYSYKQEPDNSIYRNKVKICKNVAYCYFSKTEENVKDIVKTIIHVRMIINGNKLFETKNQYVLRYW